MRITKFGHCCMLVEESGLRILVDPGTYTTAQNGLENLDIILITQEHADHYDINSIKIVVSKNPGAKILTNSAVGSLLSKEGIAYSILEHGQKATERGVAIEGIGDKHAVLYPTLPIAQNTGYMIAGRLFYPGDALTLPNRPVEILALPIAGPWLKLSEAIDYAKAVKPKVCFPVHDGILKNPGPLNFLPAKLLEPSGIRYVALEEGKPSAF